jgi:hypothetical protein
MIWCSECSGTFWLCLCRSFISRVRVAGAYVCEMIFESAESDCFAKWGCNLHAQRLPSFSREMLIVSVIQ